tara:strand:+ start:85 stop:960 length:876 start_codon:yes stop_codon:yes gene_type:complete
MDQLDLCISNYEYKDILALFKLDSEFGEEELRQAKRQVLMMHPDKSGLDKEYFLFFTSAYRLLYKVYLFRNRAEQDTCVKREYVVEDVDTDLENDHVWHKLSKHSDFNRIFNELFEKQKKESEGSDGYGNWLKESVDIEEATSKDDMEKKIRERKTNLRQLVLHKSVRDMGGNSGTSITGQVSSYQSGVFSDGLQYDDVKHAYTESVVPVTDEDYANRDKYNSIDEYQRARQTTLLNARSTANHEQRLAEKQRDEASDDISRAYELAKADEEQRNRRLMLASSLLKITDGT